MSKVKDSELYFLVLHWLQSGPCKEAAAALQQELLTRRLLPAVPSLGSSVPLDYASLRRVFGHVPPSALRELIEECVLRQSDDKEAPPGGSLSLLEGTGSLSYIPSVRARLTPSTVFFPPPSRKPNFLQRLYQRECDCRRSPLRNETFIENLTARVYERLQHNKTIRGHRKAAYCIALDRRNCYAITGADDGIIKIWDVKVGLLKTTCRGHLGEITDIKMNCDDTIFASSSNDMTTRVWSLHKHTLGHHLQAMMGHQNSVSFIAFSPVLPYGLLTVSMDGTCRLWHAVRGIEVMRLKPLGRPERFYNAGAFEKPLELAIATQQDTQFAPDSGDIGLSCCSFSPTGEHFAVSSQSGRCFIWRWDAANEAAERTWPEASETMELVGHVHGVPLLMFNHQGNALCTASSDGSVKVWKPEKGGRRQCSLRGRAWEARLSLTLPDPLPCPAYNSRRRRAAPECNQIAWSCNDQYVLAAYSCSVIMVWNATDGTEENILYGGHTDSPVHVLDAHPSDPKICFSAGYDGMLVLWDILNGRRIVSLSSKDTHPGRWRWADPLQFVDGRFRHDGMGIILSDVAGQFHMYALDPPQGAMRRTPYDQFFLYDYDKVIIGDRGEPVDMETGEPQHVHRTRFSMVDIREDPYEPALQATLLTGMDLWKLPEPSHPRQTPPSLLLIPPTVSAAFWLADETGLGENATAARVQAAHERQIALMQEEGDVAEVADFLPPAPIEELPEPEIEDDSDGSEYTPDEADPINSPPTATRRSERIQTRADEQFSPPRRRRIPTRLNPDVVEDFVAEIVDDDDEEEELELTDLMSEVESLVLSDFDADFGGTESETSPVLQPRRRPGRLARPERRSTRRRRPNRVLVESVFSASEDFDEPSARSLRAARRAAAAETPRSEAHTNVTTPLSETENVPTDNFQHDDTTFDHHRELRAYQWLSETRRPLGYYVPQVDDEVVFFPSLHESFCQINAALSTHLDERFRDDLRFAEPCHVCSVVYEIVRHSEYCPTVARVTLRLTDGDRYDDDCFFDVVIPPPYFGHEEFVMSQALFLYSMETPWQTGQECQVFYFDEAPEWWTGEIVEDLYQRRRREDVWRCEGQHRRYRVQWTEHQNIPGERFSPWELAAPDFDAGATRAEVLGRSRLDDVMRQKLQNVLAAAKDRPEAQHFRETLPPATAFAILGRTRRDRRSVFYNQVVALPVSLKLIKDRLEHRSYYTSLASFRRDVQGIVDNALLFTEPTSGVTHDAEALQKYIGQRMELEPESPETDESDVRGRKRRRGVYVESRYQIRTRGMAKRERESETGISRCRTRRRRHYT